ncbi:actin-related protein 8 [Lucilia cuprina]|uniref:actin-related protein 8 n=1 Tax=Lucilia cuprina TaxID=7375 RepID=UPI001F06395D|nr:actin-related protein 8 [Lucilia cuprina]
MQAQKIIVIHPGSLNLRIGRASDLNPLTILHAIGRRRKQTPQNNPKLQHHDPLLPSMPENDKQNEIMQEFEESRLQVSHAIQSHIPQHEERSGGLKRLRIATPPQQIATFNRRTVPEELPLEAGIKTEDTLVKKEANEFADNIFDKDLLKINVNEVADYNIHFPMKRGELNLHSNVGGSLTSVLSDLEAIWSYAIHERMEIPRKSLVQYGAVLVVPDVYNRSVLRELVTLLLTRLKFRACFLLQDHVAATFGAGLGYACVVDVGDQKCSISCVEDGISQPDTRVRLGYGGGDVTQVFYALLRKCCFPYKDCNIEDDYDDAVLLMNLKEKFCHLNLEICGAQEKYFEVSKPKKRLRYTFQLGDECVVAPLSLFHTELLNITGKQRLVRLQYRYSQQSDPEDCFDAEYIRETGRVRNGRGDQLLEGVMPVTGETAEDELVVVDNYEVEERSNNLRNTEKDEELYYSSTNGQIVPLDLAIVRSIERCSSDDMKRKMYGCILLVGGGSKIPGFSKWLEQKITLQLSATTNHNRSMDQLPFEVNVCVKEMDAAMIAWKGAAIMSCLESAPELWLIASEWEKYGLRILREKATFMW